MPPHTSDSPPTITFDRAKIYGRTALQRRQSHKLEMCNRSYDHVGADDAGAMVRAGAAPLASKRQSGTMILYPTHGAACVQGLLIDGGERGSILGQAWYRATWSAAQPPSTLEPKTSHANYSQAKPGHRPAHCRNSLRIRCVCERPELSRIQEKQRMEPDTDGNSEASALLPGSIQAGDGPHVGSCTSKVRGRLQPLLPKSRCIEPVGQHERVKARSCICGLDRGAGLNRNAADNGSNLPNSARSHCRRAIGANARTQPVPNDTLTTWSMARNLTDSVDIGQSKRMLPC